MALLRASDVFPLFCSSIPCSGSLSNWNLSLWDRRKAKLWPDTGLNAKMEVMGVCEILS